ncbi:DUF1801 domain-containing protein [Actomonas aquatica]|uniref:DUF1801 domain-containing protein n=1 Tax=Actomonas aquatica TaxID=2866162 RepID=A0ABZ1C3V7_9BACT|nr:DUF1801 domain-containing protein [Opitutus sp. WL0086]WRQ85928.1 DUF1801 domain-containing protein [Opitutus sp. WL0086]
MTPFASPAVAAKLSTYPEPARSVLLELRELIFATARDHPDIGPLTETLKWDQPSYLTEQSRSGTTLRLDAPADHPAHCALLVHCQTHLIATLRETLGPALHYEGNRAILLPIAQPLPTTALRTAITLALTYHTRKRAPRPPIGERIRQARRS